MSSTDRTEDQRRFFERQAARTHVDAEFLPPPRAERLDDLPLFTGPQAINYRADLDAVRLKDNLVHVLHLMLDGAWHSMSEIRAAGGSSGDRRLRELRQMGLPIDKERDPAAPAHSGVYHYRLRHTFSADTWRHVVEQLARRPATTRRAG